MYLAQPEFISHRYRKKTKSPKMEQKHEEGACNVLTYGVEGELQWNYYSKRISSLVLWEADKTRTVTSLTRTVTSLTRLVANRTRFIASRTGRTLDALWQVYKGALCPRV